MQQQILSLGLEQLESEERIMLHVGKIPRGFENWLSRCIWTSQSSCCTQPLPMTLWVLSGPKGNSCHFAIFWRDGTCLRLYNLKILPASRIFLPPQNTWMSPDSRQIWIFPVPRSALTCFAPSQPFLGFWWHGLTRGGRMVSGPWWVSRGNRPVNGITMYTPGKPTLIPKMMRPWKRSLRLWRWPFLVSKLNFWEVHRSTLILIKDGTPRISGNTCMTSMTYLWQHLILTPIMIQKVVRHRGNMRETLQTCSFPSSQVGEWF